MAFSIIFLSPPGRFFTHFSHVEIALHIPKIIRNRRPQLAFVEICSTQSVWGFSSNFFLCVLQPSPFNSARGRQRARVLFCAQKRKKKTKKEPRIIFLVRKERHARDDMPSQH